MADACFCDISIAVKRFLSNDSMRLWRNWQTRMVQVHVNASSWGFKSLQPHKSLDAKAFQGFFLRKTKVKDNERKVKDNEIKVKDNERKVNDYERREK